MSRIAERIEASASSGDLSTASGRVSELEDEFERVCVELSASLADPVDNRS